jgi:uncharacterized protein YbaR (Trm112 family)
MVINKELLDTLACPKCGDGIKVRGMFLVCDKCGLAYPTLNNDIPDMVAGDAWPLEKAKKSGFKHKEKL